MEDQEKPDTSFGDGGVGSQKEGFVGTDQGVLPDERKLPDENPTLMNDNGSIRRTDSGETEEGEPNAGEGTGTTVTDELRHSGRSGGEASVS